MTAMPDCLELARRVLVGSHDRARARRRARAATALLLIAGAGMVPAACDKPQPKPPTPVAPASTPAGASGGTGAPATHAPPSSTSGGAAGQAPAATPPIATKAGPETVASLGPISGQNDDPKLMTIAGLSAPKPAYWTWQAPSASFRNLQYAVPAPDGKGDPAELTVSGFVGNDGGPLDMNIGRWAGQFRTEDGKQATPTVSEVEVDGLRVHLIEMKGKYQGMSAPVAKPNSLHLGAIVEAPRGRLFIRLIGPEATVEANRAAWDALINGLRRSPATGG